MSMIGNLLRVTKAELETYIEDSSLLEKVIYPEDDVENPKLTDIDKAWDGIIFLLTGEGVFNTEHPLRSVLFSGQLIDEQQDLGYGPAHYLTPEEVVDINNQIASLTTEQLKQNFNPQKMMESDVYPEIWDEGEEAFDYLIEHFQLVQAVYAEAVKNGEAIISFLN